MFINHCKNNGFWNPVFINHCKNNGFWNPVFKNHCKNKGFCRKRLLAAGPGYLGLRVPMGTQDGNQTMRPLFGAANLESRESLPRAAGTHRYPGWQPNDSTPIWSRKPGIKGNYYWRQVRTPTLAEALVWGIYIYICAYVCVSFYLEFDLGSRDFWSACMDLNLQDKY